MAAARRGRTPLGRDFHRLLVASVSSNLADGVALVALPWLATTLTRDPLLVSGLPLALLLPWFVVSLPAGAVIDRTDRRRLMAGVAAFRCAVALLLAALLLAGAASLPLLYAAALLLGAGEVLFDTASQAILPAIVPRGDLERANGHVWAGQMLSNDLAGRSLGGLLAAAAIIAPFAFHAAATALATAAMARVRGDFRPAQPPGRGGLRLLARDVRVGLAWLADHATLRSLALMVGVLNFAFGAFLATFVLFAQEILEVGATGFGVLMSVSAVGGLAGSQAAGAAGRRLGIAAALHATLAASVVGFAVIAAVPSAAVAAVALVGLGFAAIVWNVLTVSLRQRVVAGHLLGRVNSVYRFLGRGALPLGTLFGGALVAVVEAAHSREAGLRAPLVAATVVHAAALVAARAVLSEERIASLLRDAEP